MEIHSVPRLCGWGLACRLGAEGCAIINSAYHDLFSKKQGSYQVYECPLAGSFRIVEMNNPAGRSPERWHRAQGPGGFSEKGNLP
jgi:hypothetical protein